MNQTELVSKLIDKLSSNPDIKQELWLRYLEGDSVSSLTQIAKQLNIYDGTYRHHLELEFMLALCGPVGEVLNKFSEYENSVLGMLAIGLSVSEIALVKNTYNIRILQTLEAIKYNPCWEQYKTMLESCFYEDNY